METLIFLNYPPSDIRAIERIIEERESFVAILDGDLYRMLEYLLARGQFQFSAMLDRNVYTRITALVSGAAVKPNERDDLRWAAAILAFCQIADITFDYASSLQEFAHTHGGAAALKEIETFRIADNSDPRIFIDFALGRTAEILPTSLATPDNEPPKHPAEAYEKRSSYFRVNYTFALKIAELSQRNISSVDKMTRFLDWMYADFIFGSPALLFASRYFSPNRHKRMIKSAAKNDIENAAWDMTLVQAWRKNALKGAEMDEPVLLISGDKAVRDMARRMVADSEDHALSMMREVWGKNTPEGIKVQKHYQELWEKASSAKSGRCPPDYRAQITLLEELERKVLLPLA